MPSVGLEKTTWTSKAGRPRQTSLRQIGDGSAAYIQQEWDLDIPGERDQRYGPLLPKF